MRAMAVGDRDALQIPRLATQRVDCREREPRVALEQRVDERQLARVVEEEGVDVPSLAVTEAVDPRRELRHGAVAPARFQGANGFATPCNAGSSSGWCRSSSVRIELLSTQSMPSLV